ncbi:MAG TPA: VCBS domain-containing protein, partial [Burkholderiaceae bacterium]|nr:VCBS domain-containing protein [Burkholderiaceae bacterium]
ADVGTGNIGAPLIGKLGTLTLNPDGSYTYTADQPGAKALKAGETATDVFTYAISDGNGGTAYTTLTITVTGIVRALPLPPAPADFNPIRDASLRLDDRDSKLITEPPGVWDGHYDSHRVTNLSMPLHPIVYVEVTVQREQQLRDHADLKAMGIDVNAVLPRESELSSRTPGLGDDKALFVKHAVDDAAREQMLLQSRVLGRDGRVTLSADNLLPNHSIFAPGHGLQWLRDQRGDADLGESHEADVDQGTAPVQRRGASAFSDQLRSVSQPRFANTGPHRDVTGSDISRTADTLSNPT